MPKWLSDSLVLLALLLPQVSVAPAAPAPPSRVATAEVVLAVGNGNIRWAAEWLLSAFVRDAIARSEGAKGLGCLKRENDPVAWLATRLKVEVDEKRRALTIRVVNCPRQDALPLLRAVVEVYKVHVCPVHSMLSESRRRYECIQRNLAAAGKVVPDEVVRQFEALIRESEARIKGLVLQPPQLVPTKR